MFDQTCLENFLVSYKRDFVHVHWRDEQYKWKAVKCFQDNWDINADDFAKMLAKSIAKTSNLLASVNNFPGQMIVQLATADAEKVRAMFINLFDESKDIYARINAFKQSAQTLIDKSNKADRKHYQNENAISTYLWLRYPDKYYIYKWSEVNKVAKELHSTYHFKKGAYADNIRSFYNFYNEINNALKRDTELIKLFHSQLNDDCYPDSELRTLTIDVGFYISRSSTGSQMDQDSVNEWIPSDYTPGLSVDDWKSLLHDRGIFTPDSLNIMKRMLDYGGVVTCKQLAVKYGKTSNYYNMGASTLAQRVAKKAGLSEVEIRPGELHWWPILFTGKAAGKDKDSGFIWRLRDELSTALKQTEVNDLELDDVTKTGDESHRFWWLNANPKI